MEKTMETLGPFKGICRVILGLYWGYIGIMQKKMEATIIGVSLIRIIVYWGLYCGPLILGNYLIGVLCFIGVYGEYWKRKWKLL